MATQFERFKGALEKMLMLDQADLDFGIYRIMNQKRNDIEKYLNNDLKKQVAEAVSGSSTAEVESVKAELASLIKTLTDAGIDPETSPKVKDLRAKLSEGGDTESLENEVYSHLTTFFSRYYDDGDFISQRRYKKDVYAIPYEGEEVKLHWANADQYYIKTGEYFRSYKFTLPDGKHVEFSLKDVEQDQNNNVLSKEQARYFAIYEIPTEVVDDLLRINFTYLTYKKTARLQDKFIKDAYDVIEENTPKEYYSLFNQLDNERTVLHKQLKDFVARNKFDYFIHKDLNGFLSRELDFFIKNEILVIDDIDAQNPKDFVQHLTIIKAIKAVGKKIITFLASLEDFQKKLWLKKKFVVQADYCITLDRVPEELYPEICANDKQREEWVKLFAIEEIKKDGLFGVDYTVPLTVDFLKANPFLVLDTAFFSSDFKNELLSEIDSIDEQCDGLVINSENFQALELLQEKYNERVGSVYTDPPYNTGDDGFVYKDGYSDSSWLSMINDRLPLANKLLSKDASSMVSIGDEEQEYLSSYIRQTVGKPSFVATLIWEKKKKGSFLSGNIAKMKDYILCYAKDINNFGGYIGEINTETETYPCVNPDNPVSTRVFKSGIISKFREPNVFRAAGSIISAGNMSLRLLSDLVIENRILKQDIEIEANWRYSQDSLYSYMEDNALYFTQDLYIRRIVSEARNKRMKDLLLRVGTEDGDDFRKYDINNVNRYGWGSNEDANDELHQLLGTQYALSYPKPSKLITLLLSSTRTPNSIVLDYFAGSGTTGHAVINLNREDGGSRKYILCEMGDYFNTVTKPRIQKVIYSKDWNNGKPVSREGSSHCFKYMRLEQYEDTLNNLIVKSSMPEVNGEFYDGYMLGYLLDTETKDSLFNLEWFRNPWNTKLFITRQNETKEETIDLIETFNYLIGLNVETILYPKNGICTIEGVTRTGERTLVIWRNVDEIDNDSLNKFFEKQAYSTKDSEFDRIYVNGDNTLENLRTDEESWKVVLTEKEFAKRMFEDC